MRNILYTTLLLASCLAGCRHDSDSPAPSGELAGIWRLTNLQCFCPAGQPLPDEVLTLDASRHFQLFRNGTLAAAGSYATSQGPSCSASDSVPLLTLTATAPNAYVPKGAYVIQNNTLIIDQCSAADGPKYTYQRQ